MALKQVAFKQGHALIIAVGEYEHTPKRNVPNVVGDAEAVAKVLRDRRYCGYPTNQVTVLTNSQATRQGVLDAFDALAKRVEAANQKSELPTTVFLFYAAHGNLDANGYYYLTTHDTQLEGGKVINQSGLRQDELLLKIRAIPAKRMVLLFNACYSGHISPGALGGDEDSGEPEDSEAVGRALPDALAGALLSAGEGRVIITACREQQTARFLKTAPMTFFGEKLVSALRGDEIPPRKGTIGVFDLYAYLYDSVNATVRRLIDEPQEPELTVSKGVGVMAVALHHGQAAQGEFSIDDKPALGRLGGSVREVDAEASQRLYERVVNLQIGQLGDRFSGQGAKGNIVGGDLFQVGRDLVRGNQYNAGGNLTNIGQYIVNDGATEITPQPEMQPRDYVERPVDEALLRNALLEVDNSRPVVILFGAPGTGKTSMAENVVAKLFPSRFPGGVLSASAAGLTRSELLHVLLSKLGRRWYDPGEQQLDASKLWNRLHARDELAWQEGRAGRATLVVIDDINDAAELAALQPTFPIRSRLLAISDRRLEHRRLREAQRVRIGPLQSEEARRVFEQVLGGDVVQEYSAAIDAIGQRYLLLAPLLRRAAHTIRDERISPPTYLRQLNQGTVAQDTEAASIDTALAALLNDLPPAQQRLLGLASLFGEDDWAPEILAAVALASTHELQRELQTLAQRDFIVQTSGGYRIEAVFQQACRHLLTGWSDYEREAAWRMLARYCLDEAQDLEAQLTGRLLQPEGPLADTFFADFQAGLTRKMRLIHRVLDQAVQHERWWIVQRLAALPYVSRFQRLIVTGALVAVEAVMATLEQIYITRRREDWRTSSFADASVGSQAMLAIVNDREKFVIVAETERLRSIQDRLTTLVRPDSAALVSAELYMKLISSRLSGALFVDVDLAGGEMVGVLTERVAWSNVTMTGARFAACNLSRSLWLNCNASQSSFIHSNLSGVLMRAVELRGANLAGANLTGAMLDDVDLWGANLRGANLTGAILRNARLIGADLDDVIWTGVVCVEPIMVDTTTSREIRRLIAPPPGLRQLEDLVELRDAEVQDRPLSGADLRRMNLSRSDLAGEELVGTNLANANLSGADLSRANLSRANLSGADLSRANLSGANLREATLSGANLLGATLTGADLREATLTPATGTTVTGPTLRPTVLEGATLIGANLSSAKLAKARLVAANLTGADLSAANLTNADLQRATLTGALAVAANLTGANLTAADLRIARLDKSFLYNATLTGANLAGAQLQGAMLREADCSGAIFIHANAAGAVFERAHCDDADFTAAQLDIIQLAQTCSRSAERRVPTLRLPSGNSVATITGSVSGVTLAADLSLATLQGTFRSIDLSRRALVGAKLVGTFEAIKLHDADLRGATLEGTFQAIECQGANMRGAVLDGTFNLLTLANTDLAGARLEGSFVAADLSGVNLAGAWLDGAFADLDLRNAQLAGATLKGSLVRADLRGTNLQDVVLDPLLDLSFVDFRNTRGLDEQRLRAVQRLRGAILPDGQRYEGEFELPGDQADAAAQGIDLADSAARAAFYAAQVSGSVPARTAWQVIQQIDLAREEAGAASLFEESSALDQASHHLKIMIAADQRGNDHLRQSHLDAAIGCLAPLAAKHTQLQPLLDITRQLVPPVV